MRCFRPGFAVLALLALPAAAPPAAPAAAPKPAAKTDESAPKDAVVARVNGQDIHLSEVEEAAKGLPPELRGVPLPMLYPMLLKQTIDRTALTIQARKEGLQNDPKVQQAMAHADDEVLQNALLNRDVAPLISEDAIRARYDQQYKNKPGEQEVHAEHILVPTEDQAKKIIAELKGGANFADLAKKYSTDPGAKDGGDLGWFKRGDMVPEFAAAAFSLKPGEITQTPVHTQFGWHVIKVEAVKTDPPETLEQAHDRIRQALITEGVKKVVAEARQGLKIEEFNPDGSPKINVTGGSPHPDAAIAAPPGQAASPAAPDAKH